MKNFETEMSIFLGEEMKGYWVRSSEDLVTCIDEMMERVMIDTI